MIFMWKIQFQHSDVETNVHCIPIFCIKFFFYFLSYLWYLNIFWTLFHLSRRRTNFRGEKYTPVFPIVVTIFFSSSSPTRLRGIAIET